MEGCDCAVWAEAGLEEDWYNMGNTGRLESGLCLRVPTMPDPRLITQVISEPIMVWRTLL